MHAPRSRIAEAAMWASTLLALAFALAPRVLHLQRAREASEPVRALAQMAWRATTSSATLGRIATVSRAPAAPCCAEPNGTCANGSRYQYELSVAPDRFTARALGDLDCNGVFSTFELAGERSALGWRTGPVRARSALE